MAVAARGRGVHAKKKKKMRQAALRECGITTCLGSRMGEVEGTASAHRRDMIHHKSAC
jgi:hypothetical protein